MPADVREGAQIFKYEKPEVPDQGKSIVTLCQTNHLEGVVQVWKTGGENNLHAHRHRDGLWLVLSGRARFYTEGDKVLAELVKRVQNYLSPERH